MGGAMSLFTLIAGMSLAFMAGFWIGRILHWKEAEGGEATGETETAGEWRGTNITSAQDALFRSTGRRNAGREKTARTGRPAGQEMAMEAADLEEPYTRQRRRKGAERVIPTGKAIGSPCSGEVSFFYEGSRRGAVIEPSQGLLYAPASGKITRLYPMGNAFLLSTDFGIELLLKVGSKRDELLSMYYRPRIVQNEIVNKGKLLLEFDLEGLKAQGAEVSVSVTVEAADDYRDILVTEKENVRVGETVLWVRDRGPGD